MWCVRVHPDGRFRAASEQPTAGRAAFSLDGFRRMDPDAAEQFAGAPTADESRRLQLAFIAATGLDLSARLTASMRQARTTYGGTPCADRSTSATTAKHR